MSRKALLAAALVVSIGVLGVTITSAQQAPVTVPQGSNPYYLYPVPGVQPVPMLVTPTARFDSPPPTVGISNAGQAGISANSPVGATSTWGPSTVVYTTMQPETVVGTGPVTEVAGGAGRLINDMGPSYYSDVLPAASGVSLGEVAAQLKASKTSVNARMLTNDDVGHMVGTQTGVTLAKNMPPLGPAVSGLMGLAQGAAQPAPQTAQSNPSAQQGQNTLAQAGTPPPAPATQGQTGSEPSPGNATTPEVNPHPQSNDAQGKGRLPATSTLLPLLGLLGAVSGGIGLWFRKFRR